MIRVYNLVIIIASVWEDGNIIEEDRGFTYHDFMRLELLKEVAGTRGCYRRKYQKLSNICPKYNSAYSWSYLSLWQVHEQGIMVCIDGSLFL